MAFKFQINKEVEFNHDEKLLLKADNYRSTLKLRKESAKDIVELIKSKQWLEGTGVKKIGDIEDLKNKKMTRGDKVIIDFGQHCVGKFSIDISHTGSPMDSPLTLKVKFAEMPNEFSYNSGDYNGWLSKSWIQEELLHIDNLPFTLKLPRRYSFRYIEIMVVDSSPKWQAVFSDPKVEVQSAVIVKKGMVPDIKDKELQKIYSVGLDTLKDCMQDVFEDGPKRDRRLWLGDLRLQALSNYESFKDTKLVKRCLYLFAGMTAKDGRIPANVFTGNNNYIPDDTFMYDYSLFFISTLSDLMNYEFDKNVLEDLYPIAKKQVDYMKRYIDDNGMVLCDSSYESFVDWSDTFDKTTSTQAITIYVFRQFIDLCNKNDYMETKSYKETLKKMEKYSIDNLYDEVKGLFVSGEKKEINIASQVWMVLAHVMNDELNNNLMIRTVEKLFPIKKVATPYMYHHIVQALFEANMNEEAIDLMKKYWGKMISLGADTYWEAFEPEKTDFSPYGSPIVNSYCHAWSCTPVYLINKYINQNGKQKRGALK